MYVDRSNAILIAVVALGSVAGLLAGFFTGRSTYRKRSSVSSGNNVAALNAVVGNAAASSAGAAGRRSKSSKSPCSTQQSEPAFSTVYTMTNQPNNEILIYKRNVNTGKLSFVKRVATEGAGTNLISPGGGPNPVDDPLASTGSIIVTGEGSQKCLLAVNSASNSVSSFQIKSATELELVDTYDTGDFPVSIAERKGLVYVLGVEGSGSIAGFTLLPFTCELSSLRFELVLNQDVPGPGFVDPPVLTASPAQVGFTPENNLLVTIKQNGGGDPDPDMQAGSLNVYRIDDDLTLTDLDQTSLTTNGLGTVPFSFTFDDDGNLLLLEVIGADGSFDGGGQLDVIANVDDLNGENPTFQNGNLLSEANADSVATCWVKYNPKTSCVYATNNIGNSISSFHLSETKEVTLVSNEAALLNAPLDMVLSPDFQYLYALSTGHTDESEQPQIFVYEMQCDCGLKIVQNIEDGLPDEDTRAAENTGYIMNASGSLVNGIAGLALYEESAQRY